MDERIPRKRKRQEFEDDNECRHPTPPRRSKRKLNEGARPLSLQMQAEPVNRPQTRSQRANREN